MQPDDNLGRYLALLQKWQPKINLISSKTLDSAWERHFEDSIQLSAFLPEKAQKLMDLGSGAGFPGLVLAMKNPHIDVTLVESDQRKCAFLQTVSRETKTNVRIFNERIESVVSRETAPDVVTARALASLDALLDYCSIWIDQKPDLVFVLPKGENAEEEIVKISENWCFELEKHASITDPHAQILVLKHVSRM